MKKIIIAIILTLALMGSEKVLCPKCQEEGTKSTVTCGGMMLCTSMACGFGYYDEEGDFHPSEPCNSCSISCQCSKGHTFGHSTRSY